MTPKQIRYNRWALDFYRPHGELPYDYMLVEGGRGSSKALRNDTPIPTPTGWKPIGNLNVGDLVFGSNGEIVTVTGVFPSGERPIWAVKFRHGETIFCDADHLWCVTDNIWRKRRNRRKMSYEWWQMLPPLTTAELAENLTWGKRGDLNLSIPLAGALRLPDADYLIPPYALGAWLGDGISSAPDLTVAADDYPHFREMFESVGEVLHEANPSSINDSAPRYPITKTLGTGRSRSAGFVSRLKRIGVYKNKHIPVAYLRGSVRQRTALLAGLMDTDGSVDADGSSAVFTSTNKRLADEVQELVISLGVRATIREQRAVLNGEDCGPYWAVEYFPFDGCVLIERKRSRIRHKTSQHNRDQQRMIRSVEPTVETAPVTCISVDSQDRLYLAGRSMIPTHNTWEITQALIVKGHQQPLRIVVAREHLKSIDESAKPELEDRISRLDLMRPDCYRVSRTSIDHANGTHFFFIGLSRLAEEDIKGLAMVDLCWLEEAHRVSHSSWELLVPTIRKDDAQIWASWNNKFRTDAISKFQISSRDDPLVWHKHVTYRDNAYFTPRNDRDRQRYKRENPERYPHIWEGAFDDVSDKRKVLPFALLQTCVDAWKRRPKRGAHASAGLDVADTGADRNALALRSGPELFRFDRWRGSETFTTTETARKAAGIATLEGVTRFQYDAGGPGAGVRGPLREKARPFSILGCQFGGKVQAPEVDYIRGRNPKTQEQYFANWASQAGWVLRIRAENTAKLMAGESIDPTRCLFINPAIPNLADLLAEMAQPEWDDSSGKLKINKQPREPGESEPPSPDGYDAAILAFSNDAARGIVRPY